MDSTFRGIINHSLLLDRIPLLQGSVLSADCGFWLAGCYFIMIFCPLGVALIQKNPHLNVAQSSPILVQMQHFRLLILDRVTDPAYTFATRDIVW
jgi:hypothetical protein